VVIGQTLAQKGYSLGHMAILDFGLAAIDFCSCTPVGEILVGGGRNHLVYGLSPALIATPIVFAKIPLDSAKVICGSPYAERGR